MTTATANIIHPGHLARITNRAALHRLNLTCLNVMCELAAASGAHSLSALASKLELTAASLTGVADKLDAMGLATRQPSQFDRRVIWLHLTEKGQRTLDDILDA